MKLIMSELSCRLTDLYSHNFVGILNSTVENLRLLMYVKIYYCVFLHRSNIETDHDADISSNVVDESVDSFANLCNVSCIDPLIYPVFFSYHLMCNLKLFPHLLEDVALKVRVHFRIWLREPVDAS